MKAGPIVADEGRQGRPQAAHGEALTTRAEPTIHNGPGSPTGLLGRQGLDGRGDQ